MWESLSHEFVNPTAPYRGKPFWSWNGKLEPAELIRQVHILREMGFGGFFMHSRTGLETEYLGDEWFSYINACADEAERLGMEAWLYDEDRWPSGTAGGMVTVDPHYRMKYILLRQSTVGTFSWAENSIALFSARYEGLLLHEYTPITCEMLPTLSADTPLLVFTLEEMQKSSFYNGYTYVDTLNRQATERFIELTHEKYRRYCGDRLGRSIKGIFTDEPHRGKLMTSFGSNNGEEKEELEWSVPWSAELFARFQQQFGYQLQDRLPELFLWYHGERVSQVKWHFTELLQILFIEHFVQPLDRWSSKHHLRLTGHFLHEDSLTAQTAMGGSMMRLYENLSDPGVDVLTESNRNYWIVKQLTSIARQTGRTWLLSELYGCTGWQMSFENYKAIGDWQALLGITMRCPHLSWYTMQGEAKRDYPASILHQSAWWRDYAFVESYFARIALVMSHGQALCETLVISPLESVWCQIYPGWCAGLEARDPAIVELEARYAQLFHWLAGAQLDFDYADEQMLSRLASVERDEQGKPLLRVGQASYRQVILAGLTTVRSTTLDILREFCAAGGQVIFAGTPPAYVDALPSNEALQLASRTRQVAFEQMALVEACNNYALVELYGPHGEPLPDIFLHIREDAGSHAILLLNTSSTQDYPEAQVTIRRSGSVREWNCRNGERYTIVDYAADTITFTTHFSPGGERLYIVTPQQDASLPHRSHYRTLETITLPGPFAYTLSEPNVLVLDYASYRLDEGPWQSADEILKVDRRVRASTGLHYRAGNMLQPWFTKKTSRTSVGRLELHFEFFIDDLDALSTGPIELAIEQPEQFVVKVNGTALDTTQQQGWWIDVCFKRVPLARETLVEGRNVLSLETAFHQGTNLEALYLLGPFGVYLAGTQKHIRSLPACLAVGDTTPQGLPFYSGKITYLLTRPTRDEGKQHSSIVLESFGGACVKVNPSSPEAQIIAWQPYEADIAHTHDEIALEVALTRRNTFGPLHQLPLDPPWIGPDSFVTEEPYFTSQYMLIPSGLLSAPRILKQTRMDGNEAG